MRLSTRVRYGLRAVVDLAENYGREPVSMAVISENHGISRKYLHAILSILRSGGLVRSVRGTAGGYVLIKDPSEIRVIDVLEVLEGTLDLAECVSDQTACERAGHCVTREVWRSLSEAIESVLASMTLKDLVLRSRKAGGGAPMYHI